LALFAGAYQPESASHSAVFFSHNKSASASAAATETISRTGPKYLGKFSVETTLVVEL
jgi:hypothetical protein